MKALDLHLRWVNSDRQLADGLTKSTAAWKLAVFQLKPTMKLVWDPEFTAAKKLKRQAKATVPQATTPSPPTITSPSPSTDNNNSNKNTNNKQQSNITHNKRQTNPRTVNRRPTAAPRRPGQKARTPTTDTPPQTTPQNHDRVRFTQKRPEPRVGVPGNGRPKLTRQHPQQAQSINLVNNLDNSINLGDDQIQVDSMD